MFPLYEIGLRGAKGNWKLRAVIESAGNRDRKGRGWVGKLSKRKKIVNKGMENVPKRKSSEREEGS